ncbi:AAA family ATPase [Kribbella sp. NPDC003557]|uniref:AAA family ATPase n=1 Tax=Kribbella sp. NPDC003557 TaxID=3154449 RepID=UPI0033BAB833
MTATTSGFTILSAAAGSGKSGLSVGFARILRSRGLEVQAFKPVSVVNLADVACPEPDLWRRGAFYNCNAADRPVSWWNAPVVVVPAADEQAGEIFVGGSPVGEVPIASADQIDFSAVPATLRKQAVEAIELGFRECTRHSDVVLQEGAGGTGAIAPEDDLANFFACRVSQLPAVLVAKAGKVGQVPALVGAHHIARAAGLPVAGFILNQVLREEQLPEIRHRVESSTGLAFFGSMPNVGFPEGFDGSLAAQRALDDHWGELLLATGTGQRVLHRFGIGREVSEAV